MRYLGVDLHKTNFIVCFLAEDETSSTQTYPLTKAGLLLGTMAHNVVVWARRWLQADAPKLKKYGVPRMVRDVMAVSGFVELGRGGAIKRVVLNQASVLGRHCGKALRGLLKREHVQVILGETYVIKSPITFLMSYLLTCIIIFT